MYTCSSDFYTWKMLNYALNKNRKIKNASLAIKADTPNAAVAMETKTARRGGPKDQMELKCIGRAHSTVRRFFFPD